MEVDPDVRNAIVRERGDLTMSIESYELIDSVDDPSDTLEYDGGANAETWNDALRLQREGLEPQLFSRISCPVLMLHGHIDPHPGAATRDVLRRFIPHLQYVEFEKCGHEPWKDNMPDILFDSTSKLAKTPLALTNRISMSLLDCSCRACLVVITVVSRSLDVKPRTLHLNPRAENTSPFTNIYVSRIVRDL